LNRATDGLFSPGSTFKVVTASAALNTGRFTIDSTFTDPGYCIEYGKRVHNSLDQNGPEVFGSVNFTQALQHSINAVFCDIGKAIGAGSILDYSRRYGFYARPPLETPSNERAPSGLYDHHKLFFPRHPDTAVDPGRLAFGQERMLATPLQMAMVAGTVANGGREMRPYVVDHVTDPGGTTISTTHPEEIARPISRKTAEDLTSMMEAVVTGGTGTAAQIPGIRVAGKTGTAETGGTKNTTWFIAFAPADNPKVAVAVVLENQTGFGGTTAAPIAKTILQALLSRR
jgi:peptidoglycan glycosyltransferase